MAFSRAHAGVPGSDRASPLPALAVRGLIVFALGLAIACVARVIFMVWVYACIALIGVSLCVWRAAGPQSQPPTLRRAQPSYCGP
jgi:hypothetical protein